MADPVAGEEEIAFLSLESLFETTVNTICPFGDIVLVVKDDFLPTAKFKVSSCILAMASKVFTGLFSSNFAEGKRMCSRAPGEVVKIETTDSPIAMKHLLKLLHHADPLDPGEKILTTSALLDLAIIIDKYDCIAALRLPTDALLAKYIGNEDYKLDHLSTAAFMLDQPTHFRHFTKELVSTKVMVQAKHFDKRCLELLPPSLLPSLFCQQSMALKTITAQVTQFIEKFTKACKVADRQTLVFDLLDELTLRGLWPMAAGAWSVQTFCSLIEDIDIPVISANDKIETSNSSNRRRERSSSWNSDQWEWDPNPQKPSNDGWGHFQPPIKHINAPGHHELKHMADTVRQLVVGVCLDCIQNKECRKRHRYYWSDTESQTERYKVYEDSEGDSVYSRRDSDDDQYDVFQWDNKHPGYWEDLW